MAIALNKTNKALRDAMEAIALKLRKNLAEKNAFASGNLEESIDINFKKASKGLEYNITMLDYWEFVDKGRKPGKRPPTSSIEKWLSYPNVRDKIRGGQNDKPIDNIQSLAYIIAKKIGDKGTKGTDFFTDLVNSRQVNQDLPKAIGDAMFEDLDLALTEVAESFSTFE